MIIIPVITAIESLRGKNPPIKSNDVHTLMAIGNDILAVDTLQ